MEQKEPSGRKSLMEEETVSMLAAPKTRERLKIVSGQGLKGNKSEELIGVKSGEVFRIAGGIPVFLNDREMTAFNRQNRFYNLIAPFYDTIHAVQTTKKGGQEKMRRAFLEGLEIKDGDLVLEVPVGTGANLRYLPRGARYFGLDVSPAMLKVCGKNARQQGINVNLFCGEAGRMPFRDGIFDCVFSICGLRLVSDKAGALKEMVRVAKKGTKIVVVDQKKGGAPIDLVPSGTYEVMEKHVPGWAVYCLSFRKR